MLTPNIKLLPVFPRTTLMPNKMRCFWLVWMIKIVKLLGNNNAASHRFNHFSSQRLNKRRNTQKVSLTPTLIPVSSRGPFCFSGAMAACVNFPKGQSLRFVRRESPIANANCFVHVYIEFYVLIGVFVVVLRERDTLLNVPLLYHVKNIWWWVESWTKHLNWLLKLRLMFRKSVI